jgi:formyl-CoA transferase
VTGVLKGVRVVELGTMITAPLAGMMLAIHLSSQSKFWDGMLAAVGCAELANDNRFEAREVRIKNFVELTQVLAETFVTKPRAEWMTLLESNDVPFAPVHNIPDVIDDPQIRHLETFRTLRHPTEGETVSIRRRSESTADVTVRICRRRRSGSIPAKCCWSLL